MMRLWHLLRQKQRGFLLGDGILQPRGLMTVATAYTGDNVRAWGTVQKFKTGVNGAFAATLMVAMYLLMPLCLYVVHIVLTLCGV